MRRVDAGPNIAPRTIVADQAATGYAALKCNVSGTVGVDPVLLLFLAAAFCSPDMKNAISLSGLGTRPYPAFIHRKMGRNFE
jgi:hypothetical protein